MEKRLKLAKRLLNPKDSVLIVTIDEKEYLHLGCLLEEMFPEAHIQMVSIVINPNGVARDHEMYRLEEYAFFIYKGDAGPAMLADPLFTSDVAARKMGKAAEDECSHSQRTSVRWERLLRGGSNSNRSHSPGCFYPVYIDPIKRKIVEIGEAIGKEQDKESIPDKDGLVTIWPISEGRGEEKVWRTTPSNLRSLVQSGYAKVGAYNKNKDRWSLLYLGSKQRERIEDGQLAIIGRDENGVVIVEEAEEQVIKKFPKTIWNRQSHSAGEYGSRLIRAIIPGRDFSFPKSLYAVRDTLKTIVANKPNALIVDFFAGSGTTLHAVNLLNAEDGGHRRCILVTNNEVSEAEAKDLTKKGYKPGDPEWEKLGIARYVTWPRTVCSIEGHDINGNPLKGNYIGSDIPMADGFKSNCTYFKIAFLDKTEVALGRQFREILPILWMKSGCVGACPDMASPTPSVSLSADISPSLSIREGRGDNPYLFFPANHFAVLFDEASFSTFQWELHEQPQIQTVFLVTDYEVNYRAMKSKLHVQTTYQLYRDYLDNFRINHGRNER